MRTEPLPRYSRRTNTVSKSPLRRLLGAAVIGVVGAWVGVVIWNGVDGNLGIVTVHASVHPALVGRTVLRIPPLGALSARTHIGPARIDLSIDQVHIQQTAQWLRQHKSPKQTAAMVEGGITRTAYRLARVAILVAALGAFAGCVLFKLRLKHALWGTVFGVLGVAIPLALAALTYNPAAFENPQFEGEMSRAPQLLDTAQQAWQSNATVMQDLPRIANRTVALCQRLGQGRLSGPPDYYRALLISDLHNNPVGARFALDLARTYKVDLVLVDGDFTDLGHPLETDLLAGLGKFDVPIVAVAGNHDSRATIRALRTIPGLVILDNGRTVREGDLSIMGFGDPSARRANTGSVNTTPARLRALSRAIARRLGRARPPDILMLHDNSVARGIAGRAPLIADGHSHKAGIDNRGGSLIVNPGTTGAAGIRYFSARQRPSYTACVLHFSTGRNPRLKMVDSIRMEMPSGDFAVTRRSAPFR